MHVIVKVKELQSGDQFYNPDTGGLGWTAWGDAQPQPDGTIICQVQHLDGGLSERTWDDPELQIEVARP